MRRNSQATVRREKQERDPQKEDASGRIAEDGRQSAGVRKEGSV